MVLSGLSAINASLLTTLPAHKILLPMGNITVPFLSVPKFLYIVLLSSYDFFFFGSRMANKDKEDQKKKKPQNINVGGKKHRRGSSHWGGNLNSWDEPNMQAALAEYNR